MFKQTDRLNPEEEVLEILEGYLAFISHFCVFKFQELGMSHYFSYAFFERDQHTWNENMALMMSAVYLQISLWPDSLSLKTQL